ncbi:MAG: tetratricopeptide repeat protein, partial [Gammaproteobacteria bacterium]|nr:tetratricopeptide repeat protein [Gammaproteobacteria bacterium]
MKLSSLTTLCLVASLSACSSNPHKDTTIEALSEKTLNLEEPIATPLKRENTSEFYRRFLRNAPKSTLYGDALRRLADIELQTGQEKGASDNKKDRVLSRKKIKAAIGLYETFLKTYPNRTNNDLILYQLAKAYELDLQQDKFLLTLNTIVRDFPKTRYIEEVQFRRGETYFVSGKYKQAEEAYSSIINNHPDSGYYEKSLYKYGWSRFKQSDYAESSHIFIRFLERKYQQGQLSIDGPSTEISRSDKELLMDVLRVTSLSFSYQQGHISVTDYFTQNGQKPFESIIYNNLAELYLEKDRIRDASVTYLAYSKRYPTSSLAPKYHSKAIDAYKKGGFASLVLPAKISFVKQYGMNTDYWKVQSITARESITPLLKQHIQELANHYHAQARKIKTDNKAKKKKTNNTQFVSSITEATTWYKLYITSFPKDNGTEKINFLLAEAHQDAGQYKNAIYQFEKTAYQYPQHKQQENAAYAALLLYPAIEKSLKGAEQKQWQQKKISSALKFTETYPRNKYTASILANTSEELFKTGDYP